MSVPYNSYAQQPISLETKQYASDQSIASPMKLFSPSGYQQIPEPPHLERVRQKDYVSNNPQGEEDFRTV